MDPTILSQLQSFSLSDAEEYGLTLEHTDISTSAEDCQKSLIGRIHGEKIANYTGLKNTLSLLWTSIAPFKVRELGKNLFQFFFASQEDLQTILHHKGWTFEGQFLILKPWQENLDLLKLSFNTVPIWIQVWNLPPHWLSKETGFRFKNLFKDVVDVLIPEGGSRKGCHLKLLAEIDLSKPLLRGTKLRFKDQVVWVRFEYERMATFCFYCGFVGHLEKNCTTRLRDVKAGSLKVGQYGDWLRASTFHSAVKVPRPVSPLKASSSELEVTRSTEKDTLPPPLVVAPVNSPQVLSPEEPPCQIISEGAHIIARAVDTNFISQHTTILEPSSPSVATNDCKSVLPPPPASIEEEPRQSNMLIDPPLLQLAPVLRAHLSTQDLVTVPVQLSSNKGILKERASNILVAGPSSGQNQKQIPRKKWTRKAGKENSMAVRIPQSE